MRVCLIGATHPSHNPRLVREADCLADRGHEVRVVAPSIMPEMAERDRQLVASRRWRLRQIRICGTSVVDRICVGGTRARRRLAQAAFTRFGTARLAACALSAAAPGLATVAAAEPADWFIAHTHAALPAALSAARKWRARLGFDCEDLLTASEDQFEASATRAIENACIGSCDYVTVPSPAIAASFECQNGIRPVVLYNTFPVSLAAGLVPPQRRPQTERLRLHWVGQTIGPDKGIEEAVAAVALLGDRAELHLRGQLAIGHDAFISDLEHRYRVNVKVYPLIHHDELVDTMGSFDVGLALERPESGTYSVTVTNKFFLYLLAGLGIAATATVGQREILNQVPGAGFVYPAGRPDLLAQKLLYWADHRIELIAAQQNAWDAARTRFCWDLEQQKFLQLLGLNEPAAVSPSLERVAAGRRG